MSTMTASSSNLLILFKDLSGSCEKVFHLLNDQDKEIALLVLRGRFFQININNHATEHNESKISNIKNDFQQIPDESGFDLNPSKVMKYSEDFKGDIPIFVNFTESLDSDQIKHLELKEITNEKYDIGAEMDKIWMKDDQGQTKTKYNVKKPTILSCNHCDYKTSKIYHYENHMRSTHQTSVFKCEICTFESRRRAHLKVHIKKVHPTTESSFICNQCEYTFETMENMKTHIESSHQRTVDQNEIDIMKKDLMPMSFAEAKIYLIKMQTIWQRMGLLESPLLKKELLEFGWEFQDMDKPPKCNEKGKTRLRGMFK